MQILDMHNEHTDAASPDGEGCGSAADTLSGNRRPETHNIIFEEFFIGSVRIKNRLIRSSISGRIDNYDGSGTRARINFEKRFARGGVGAIISSHVPIHISGRVLPNYATIDSEKRVDFWKAVVDTVHCEGSRFFIQLSYSGRQQDIGGVENWTDDFHNKSPLSATGQRDFFNGLPGEKMDREKIKEVIQWFAKAAKRARCAGADGIELHSSNGYLFTQFLSSAINDRRPEEGYGGDLEQRYQFLKEVIEAIQQEVGKDFPLIVKVGATDCDNWLFPWRKAGNTLSDAEQIAVWAARDGAHAIHVSTGSTFPHPRNPAGPFPFDLALRTYTTMIDARQSGKHTWRNYLVFRYLPWLARYAWQRHQTDFRENQRPLGRLLPEKVEGANANAAGKIRKALAAHNLSAPVICTGGFQTGDGISKVLHAGLCDAVSMARPLLANPDLPHYLRDGCAPAYPCTYCNKCLVHVLENPLGCYDVSRFVNRGGWDAMIEEVMSIFDDETTFEGDLI